MRFACTELTYQCKHLHVHSCTNFGDLANFVPYRHLVIGAHQTKKTTNQGDFLSLAGPTGFEPAISSVTGRRVRPATPRARILGVRHVVCFWLSQNSTTFLAHNRIFVSVSHFEVFYIRLVPILDNKFDSALKRITYNASEGTLQNPYWFMQNYR
jgi:hypothetical protein